MSRYWSLDRFWANHAWRSASGAVPAGVLAEDHADRRGEQRGVGDLVTPGLLDEARRAEGVHQGHAGADRDGGGEGVVLGVGVEQRAARRAAGRTAVSPAAAAITSPAKA